MEKKKRKIGEVGLKNKRAVREVVVISVTLGVHFNNLHCTMFDKETRYFTGPLSPSLPLLLLDTIKWQPMPIINKMFV